MKRNVIAVDFDGTITERNEFPKIGKIRPYAAEVINKLQAKGYVIYLWTCRCGKPFDDAVQFLNDHDIYLDGYNQGPSTGSRKLIADVYIDDMAFPNSGYIDWLDIADYFGIKVS